MNKSLETFSNWLKTPQAEMLLGVAALLVLAWIAYRALGIVARRIEQSVDDGDDSISTSAERRGLRIARLVRIVGRGVILGITLLLVVDKFTNITKLLAGLGILSLAVSLGAQSLVKDLIAGFFILMENQFSVGDVIRVGGLSGVVEQMTLRVVMLRDVDGVLHIVPNGTITTVSNLTRGWSRAVVDVTITYGNDVDAAISFLKNELDKMGAEALWRARFDGEWKVTGVQALGDNGVTIQALIRTVPGAQWDVAREFRRRIKNRFDREGIEIYHPPRPPIPRREQAESATGETRR